MPKVSIVLTCYNHKEFIGDAIKSVVNQTFFDRELLIGDDSPNNDTWKVIQEYVKKYPNKIHARHHEENKGITRNMEFLISKSKGEYIAVLEGDDMFVEDCLTKKLDIFENNSEVMLVYSDLFIIDFNSNITKTDFLKKEKKIKKFYKGEKINIKDVMDSFKIPYLSWSSLMFKKSVIEKVPVSIRGLSPFNIVSDYNFFLKVGSYFKIYGIEECLTKYRIHNNNISFKNGCFNLLIDMYSLFNIWEKEGFIGKKLWEDITTRYLIILGYNVLIRTVSISIRFTVKNFFTLLYNKIIQK